MANTGFKGIDVRQTGTAIVFRASLKDSSNAIVTSGTTSLKIYELQSDGTIKSYDFNDNTFKTTALTTETLAMTHRTGNNSTTNTGIWTVALSSLAGFTVGGIYIAVITNSGATPTQQEREFQYGSCEGDLSTGTPSAGVAYLNAQIAAGTFDAATSMNAATRSLLYGSWLISTGTTSPTTAGTWNIGGTLFNGRPYYTSGSFFLWYDSSNTRYVISTAMGSLGTNYWTSTGNTPGELGPWVAGGSATGTPAFVAVGVPLSAYWSYENIDSSGRLLLQPTQTGVTIPTVTTLTTLPAITTDWLTGTGVAASAVTKIQAGLATPTNITAGTITTVTNLTNLPAITTDWITAAGLSAAAVTKMQTGLATPTNITAGTITTVTNLTNAPTSGDFTATMKTSLNSATPAVTVSDKTGFALTAAYDAAKTAAQAGNQMDLVNSPNATAVAAIQSGLSTAAVTNAIKVATDHLPIDPASQTTLDAVGTLTLGIKARTDLIPNSPASTTNITAGTITNLTNAPTSGDFTAAMKTSLNAATPASVQNIHAQTADIAERIPSALVMTAGKVWVLDQDGNPIASSLDIPTAVENAAEVWGGTQGTTVIGLIQNTHDDVQTLQSTVDLLPDANVIAGTTADLLFVDGGTNPLKVNSDHSVNSTIDSSGIAADVLAGLSGTTLTVQSPLNEEGDQLELTTGDSYTVAKGTSLKFNVNNPAVVGTVAHLRIADYEDDLAVSPTISASPQEVTFGDITTTDTLALEPCDNVKYQIRFVQGSDTITMIEGIAKIKKGL